MKKFTILFDKGIWNHAIIGFDDGNWEIMKDFKSKNKEWLSKSIDNTIKVIRAKKVSTNTHTDFAFYDNEELSSTPNPKQMLIKGFREGSNTFDIQFYGDYLVDDMTWVVLGTKPEVHLSIHRA
jgi:hypothetical protein